MPTLKKTVIITAIILCGMLMATYVCNQVKKEYIKKQKLECIKDGIDKIMDLKQHGLTDADERIVMLQADIAKAEGELKEIEAQDGIFV